MSDMKIDCVLDIPRLKLPSSQNSKKLVSLKIGMLGDAQVGKTTLMVKYVKNKFDITYIETFGINTMDKTINLQNIDVKLCLWELGGQKEFASLMPVVCCDARAMLFIFDLTQKPSLLSIKRWYKEARKENKRFTSFLIGTKFDLYQQRSDNYKIDLSAAARKYAKKMNAPLIYCSSAQAINIKKIFKLIIAKLLCLKPRIRELNDEKNDALIEFNSIGNHLNVKYHQTRQRTKSASFCHVGKISIISNGANSDNDVSQYNDSNNNDEDTGNDEKVHKENKKILKKRVKKVKSRLDFLIHDEEKLRQIEKILGLSL